MAFALQMPLKWHVANPASLQARLSNNLKQTIQTEQNRIKNPTWPEATSWPIKSVGGVLNKSSKRSDGTRIQDCQIAIATLTTQPRCLNVTCTSSFKKIYLNYPEVLTMKMKAFPF